MSKLRLLVALVLIATARLASAAEPGAFAITNARIVPVSGPVIERGTVVIRDGLIAAVGGESVPVPADAWVVDGKGLTVYPGLIDALTDLGLAATAAPASGGGRTGGQGGASAGASAAPIAHGPEDRPASTPWLQAADEVRVDERRFESWRNAGFTTALTAPRTGIFPGQGAVINLAGERPGSLVVSAPASLQVTLQPPGNFGSFPGALMGVVAYVRQVYLDVQHDTDVRKAYDASPTGKERPSYDRTVKAVAEAQAAHRPVFIPATTPTQIARVFMLADELRFTPVVYGLHEGFRNVAAIAAHKTPVLVSLKWPEKDAEGDPEAEDTLRTLRMRDQAPSTPGLLRKAGVKFAFYSDGAQPTALLKNARKAVDAGLPADAAVRALTLDAADILGVANRLGSIEAGKIANLTITDGDLFGEKTKIKLVFVDGAKFDVRETPAPGRSGSGNGNGNGNGTDTADAPKPPPTSPEAATTAQATATPAPQRVPAAGATGPIVIQHAKILTVTHGTIDDGAILIRNGKIAEVGPKVAVPAGATIIDATGQYVMPGIIDCHSHIAIEGGVNEGSVSVSSMAGIEDVLQPDDVDVYRALAGGVTTANVLHGSANAIGGKNEVIKLRWGQDARGLKFEGAMPGIKFALGENPKRANRVAVAGVDRRYPATRMGVMDTIREAFVEAKEYQHKWNTYREQVKKGDKTAVAPARDLKLEPLVEILEGKRLVHAHSYRGDEILQLLRLGDEMGFKVATLQHVLEGYRVADEIKAHGTGASTFSDWWAYKIEVVDATPYNAALMTQRGVVVSINSDSAEEDRHLNQEAAKTMKYGGLSEVEALKLVTLNPAQQLRIDDRVGSIDVGKDADLVIYNTHPLSVYAVPQRVLIDGTVYFDRQKDLERRTALEQEKKTLTDKSKANGERRGPGRRPPTSTETTPRMTNPGEADEHGGAHEPGEEGR